MAQILSFWGPKLHDRLNCGEGVQKISSLKFIKIISVRIMDLNLVKKMPLMGVNLVKIGHFFMKMLEIGSF